MISAATWPALAALVRRASRSALYRERWKAAGVKPRTLSPRDWPSVPYTDAGDYLRAFRDHPTEEIVLARPALWVCSSGTAGRAKWIPWSRRDVTLKVDLTLREFELWGWQDDEVCLTLYAALPFASGTRSVTMSLTGRLEVIPSTFERADAAIAEFGPRITSLLAGPSTLVRLADSLTQMYGSVGAALPRLRMLGLGGEPMGIRRALLKELYGVPHALDAYGVSETSTVGKECTAEEGVHLFTDEHFFELIPEAELVEESGTDGSAPRGRTVEEWEEGLCGELVLTTLRRHALPLVRYRTGDRVQVVGLGPCAQRHSLPRVALQGRVAEQFLHIAGEKLPVALLDALAAEGSRVSQIRDWEARVLTGDGATTLLLRYFVQGFVDQDSLRRELEERFLRLFPDGHYYLRALIQTKTIHLAIEFVETRAESVGPAGKRKRIYYD